jgi:hypothetical protein
MARPNTKVDAKLFVSCIWTADDAKLGTRKDVFVNAANAYNTQKAVDLKTITPAIVKSRIEGWELKIETPLGKRGRKAGTKGGGRISNAQLAINSHCVSCKKSAEKIGACPKSTCHWNALRPFQPKLVVQAPAAVDPVVVDAPAVAEPAAPVATETGTVEAAAVQAPELATV